MLLAETILASGGHAPGVEHVAPADIMTPADRYQELFVAVQSGRIFPDSKSFVDCVPRRAPEAILRAYRAGNAAAGFDLSRFVAENFTPEPVVASRYVSDPGQSLAAHIDGLWGVLSRHPDDHAAHGSLLPLPHPYVVPGGRFSELYYWDSYFTMLGLAAGGKHRLLHAMADNFSFIIQAYGHIPNGNRSYYLSRSQPPVFALMVGLLERHGLRQAVRYLPDLLREYAYWMDGADGLCPGEARRHVVCLPDNMLLNRYWDDRDTPREEAYCEDVATAAAGTRPAADIYRDLRAGAASGWDFSSRWLGSPDDLSSIRTTAILPVDLNSFLHLLERQIERLSRLAGDEARAVLFHRRAAIRRRAIDRYFWQPEQGAFVDYDWALMRHRPQVTAASAVPLYVGLASHHQAHRVAATLAERLLLPGGLATTEQHSIQQWDRANGWAPLQWMAIHGMRRYGLYAQARDLSHRWLATVAGLYAREAKLVEKYAIGSAPDGLGGGGGEYPLQDGFGWTNGVTRMLLADYADHHAHHARAGRVRH
ncbi:alpha,alpha-trehalase TreF [Nguyenibacter vanlangensis]|uniref:Putative periplasmic trehalase n=1 Tax=Nguyenibacter vanlangensis TaxID=1216886 RepID=A0A7Y7IXV6_9PROT|nr:alpha,alpha-trehalase TreF [Nguyenibacter vanlangensis]NVN12393.1 alpha,alpha-trehalase TreF [Nguyenibacter vanlangensis]